MLILYFLFIHLILLIPSIGFVQKIKLFHSSSLLQLCMAYFFSITFLGISGFFLYALSVPESIVRYTIISVALAGTILFIKQGSWRVIMQNRFVLLLFLTMSLIPTIVLSLTSVQSSWEFIPDNEYKKTSNYSVPSVKVLNFAHTPANDNYIPYRQAQFFVNRSDPAKDSFINEWGVSFFQRTVLMGSVVSSFYTMLDDNPPISHLWSIDASDPNNTYPKFQIIAHILNSLLILPAFIVVSRLFSKKVAAISSIFLVSSQFYLYNSIFSWPKSLTAFFILLSIMLLLENRRSYSVMAGLVGGVAYLTHDLAIVFIVTCAIFLILKSRWKDLVFYSIAVVPSPAFWAIISSIIYSKPSTFIYYPFSLNGLPQDDNKKLIIQEFLHTKPLKILQIKLDGLVYLASPYQLFFSEGGKQLSTRLWALGIYSIPGSLGVGLLGLGIISFTKGFRKIKWEVYYFIVFPLLIILLLFGNPKILGSLHFSEPILPILIGSIVYITLGFKQYSKQLLMGALSLNILFTVFFIAYSFNFNTSEWLTRSSDLFGVFLLGIIFSILVALLYNLSFQKTGRLSQIFGISEQVNTKS